MLVAGTDLQLTSSVKRGLVHHTHISLCIHQQMEYTKLWVMWAIIFGFWI
jgi:hypothetical protein